MKHINSLSGVVGQGQKIIMKLLLIQVVKKQNKKTYHRFLIISIMNFGLMFMEFVDCLKIGLISCSWIWNRQNMCLKNSANMEVYIQKMKEKYLVRSTFFVKKGSSKKRLPCRFQILHTLIKVAERLLFSLICIQTRPVLLCARAIFLAAYHIVRFC